MTKINHQLKGRIRDKVKQVLLIDGIPEALYKVRETKVIVIKFNNRTYKFDAPTELANELKKIPSFIVKESTRKSKRFNPINIQGIGNRTTIRAVNGSTHITVGGADENQLAERVELIKEHLLSLGINTIERCHWICSTDKAKINSEYSYPHKYEEHTKKDKKEMSFIKLPVESGITTEDMGKILQPKRKEMSEHTKSLHEIALKAIKRNEAKP